MADVPGLVARVGDAALKVAPWYPAEVVNRANSIVRRVLLALADDAGLRETFAGIIWGADQADRSHATTADALMAVLRDAAKGTPA